MDDTLRLQPTLDAPRRARRWLAGRCVVWGCEDIADDAALLLSEVVTNAALHARTTITVTAGLVDGDLRIAVADRQPGPLSCRPGEGPASAEGGRGLPIVDAVAREWGVEAEHGGKVVWFTLARSQRRDLALQGQ